MKESETIMEGTGEEVSDYANAHPTERFRLIASSQKGTAKASTSRIDEALEIIEQFRDKIPVLPPEAYSTESLYD